MKLIKVTYIEQSSKAIYFNVETEEENFFFGSTKKTRRAFLVKGEKYDDFYWADTGNLSLHKGITNEMRLQYEKEVTAQLLFNSRQS